MSLLMDIHMVHFVTITWSQQQQSHMTDTEEPITKGSVLFQILQSERPLEGPQPPVELLVRPDVQLRQDVPQHGDQPQHVDQQQDQPQLDQMSPDQLLSQQPLHQWSLSMGATIT